MNNNNQRIAELEREVAELKQKLDDLNDFSMGFVPPLFDIYRELMSKDPVLSKRWLDSLHDDYMKANNPRYRNDKNELDTEQGLEVRRLLFQMLSGSITD